MYKTVKIESPAKINLHLDVFDKRDDGFHELFSIFQMISLCDLITITETENKNDCIIDGPFNFPQEENIMYRAVSLFRAQTGYSTGISIKIEKNIPEGGGLGGGSGNGASVLKALQLLSTKKLSSKELFEAAAFLGSDVPFFCSKEAAVVTGRGEVLKPIKPRIDYSILLIIPDFKINTAEAFSVLANYRKNKKSNFPLKMDQVLEMYSKKAVFEWKFHNSFLNCLKKEHNVLEHILNLFYYSDADFAGMSGSGSVMFGIFNKHKDCLSAYKTLSGTFGSMLIVNPLDTVPIAALQFR